MSTDAKKILEMIEAVNPNDTVMMDEIDFAVFKFINPNTRAGIHNTRRKYIPTRSRDLLKAIRPEGWIFYICNFDFEHTWVQVEAHNCKDTVDETPALPTEELAELHAIIQVIEYERTNKP